MQRYLLVRIYTYYLLQSFVIPGNDIQKRDSSLEGLGTFSSTQAQVLHCPSPLALPLLS